MKPHFRDQRGKHIHEDAAMQIVLAVKHDIAPDMDDNAGGELLGWILQLTEDVATSPALAEAAVPPRGVDVAHLKTVLCWVSQIFNGWRGCEEWSQFDEEVSRAVVDLQRQIENHPSAPNESV